MIICPRVLTLTKVYSAKPGMGTGCSHRTRARVNTDVSVEHR